MKLENREQAKAFLIFLQMERDRHEDDLKTIDDSEAKIVKQWKITADEHARLVAKAWDRWVDVD